LCYVWISPLLWKRPLQGFSVRAACHYVSEESEKEQNK
jgi:hypothetical protein